MPKREQTRNQGGSTLLGVRASLLALAVLAAMTIPRLTAEQLAREYSENEIAADSRYKGKRLRVTGLVDHVQRHFEDRSLPEILLDAGETPVGYVVCLMRKGEPEAPLTSLRKGSRVALECTGDGMPANIELRDCVTVKL